MGETRGSSDDYRTPGRGGEILAKQVRGWPGTPGPKGPHAYTGVSSMESVALAKYVLEKTLRNGS